MSQFKTRRAKTCGKKISPSQLASSMKPITVVEKRDTELEQLCAKLTEITNALAHVWIRREELVYHPETNTITSRPRENRGEDLAALRARIAELDAIILRMRSGLPYWSLVPEAVKNCTKAVLKARQAARL